MDDYNNTKDFLKRRGRLPLDDVIARLLRTSLNFWIVYKRDYDGKKCKLYFNRKDLIYFDDEIIVIIHPSCYFADSVEAGARRDYNKLKVIKVSEVIEIAGF